MQINPINNNNQTFKACYRVPYTRKEHNKLMLVLKQEGFHSSIAIYSKAGRYAKDIAVFRNPFPYEHLYNEELISALLDKNRITKEEAEKYGIKFNIFNSAKMSREVQCEILNSRLDNVRNKGVDVDSVLKSGQYTYLTTGDDTEIVKIFMAEKIESHFKECFGERKKLDPLEAATALASFYPGPNYPKASPKPKQNFIQKLFHKNRKTNEVDYLKKEYLNLTSLLKNENLKTEEIEQIADKMKTLESLIAEKAEPRYVKKVRFLVEQFNLEKEKFNKMFFENREIIPVDSVEELIEKL